MPNRLQGKVALITGSATGIGAETARLFVSEGAKVIIADFNEKGARATADSLTSTGGDATVVVYDQSNEESIKQLIVKAVEAYGTIHIVANIAAATHITASGRDKTILATDPQVWADTFQVNVQGLVTLCKHAIPELVKNPTSSIVNIASGAAYTGRDDFTAYGISKTAVIGVGRYIAQQHGKQGLRCNTISPGLIMSEATKNTTFSKVADVALDSITINRLGEPKDIGYLVLFLASDESSYITGQDWRCDGGAQLAPTNLVVAKVVEKLKAQSQ